jgi:MFS family permease
MDGETPALELETRPGARRRLATAAVLLGLVVSAFEGTVVTTAMPTITSALGGQAQYAWVFSAFLLASTLAVIGVGKLADQYGRKPVFLGGLALFLGGSALCGLATSMPLLIAFRLIQGLGAGAIQPTTMTISADLYTLQERAAVQTLFTGAWGLANVLGPVLGGFIVTHASWRWVFLVNLPVGVLAAVLLAVSYQDPPRRADARTHLGAPALLGLALGATLLGLERSLPLGVRLCLVVFGVGLGLIFFRGQRTARAPLLPAIYLGDPSVKAGLLGGAVVGAVLYATTAYVPLWLTARGVGPVVAGFALVPLLAGWAVGSSLGVIILLRGGMRWSVGAALVLAGVGAAVLAGIALLGLSVTSAFVALALLGVGLGPAASTSTIGPQSVVPWGARGVVTSAIYATRMMGGAMAIALIDLFRGAQAAQIACIAPLALLGGLVVLAMAPGVRGLRADPLLLGGVE